MVSCSAVSSTLATASVLALSFVATDAQIVKDNGFHNQPFALEDTWEDEPVDILSKEEIGSLDRFWKHHLHDESLVHDGVNHYHTIKNCIQETLSKKEFADLKTVNNHAIRKAGRTLNDPYNNNIPLLVVVENAMHPTHAKAVQTLGSCVRKVMPHLYESRAMYQEMNLDEDDGSGGNCPTHLAPLVGLFLPEVVKEMQATLKVAYEATPGWKQGVAQDQANIFMPREKKMYPPEEVGIRASELLTYSDFPRLKEHHDGDTVYTMNFAFVPPDSYEGGEFFIISEDVEGEGEVIRQQIKPNQYEAMVFLGGQYLHGVEEIGGGHREMFSTEMWAFPDTPFGANLWNNYPNNMEQYVINCNEQQKETKSDRCTLDYELRTAHADSIEDVRKKYGGGDFDDFEPEDEDETEYPYDKTEKNAHGDLLRAPFPGIDRMRDNELRPNRTRPNPLKPLKVILGDGEGNEYDLNDFYPKKEEPDFLIPKKLDVGEMVPIRWRDDLSVVDGSDGESFVVGFPPELHEEFKKYVAKSGMMDVAHKILYEEEELEPGEQRIYTLDDGEKWTAMIQGSWDSDMVWLDPGDESCFESLLGILRRGNFDKILDQVGKTFDLDGLMIQGVGAIFLSEYSKTENMHVDIPGSRGSFYNIIVPVHIPADDVAIFKLSDRNDDYQGRLRLDPNVGVVLGGMSRHGTGECNYRENEDFRLSFAIYVADINDENLDLIASDSTSLWPTKGDTFFLESQKGRLWTKDGKNSIKWDKGRMPFNIQDKDPMCERVDKDLCMTDVQGFRLMCPKTCELYLEDDVYYAKYFPNQTTPNQTPTCSKRDDPTCAATASA